MSSLEIALVQLTSTSNIRSNYENLRSVIEDLGSSVDLICTPENTLFSRDSEGSPVQEIKMDCEEIKGLSDFCTERETNLLIGSSPVRMGESLFNSTLFLDSKGNVSAPYQKMHLFDVELGEDLILKESDVYTPGDSLYSLKFQNWKIGLSICYDLRFSEVYKTYRDQDVDVLFVPAAFTPKTGKAHWKTLLQARAIETQSYVVAPAQTGKNSESKSSYGHSMVIDPWGEVLLDLGEEAPSCQTVVLDKDKINEVRKMIPVREHSRL